MKFEQSYELREMNFLYREQEKIIHKMALKLGLSDSAFSILYDLADMGDGILQKDIAERYFCSRQTINSSVKKLEAEGFIYLKQGKRRDMHIYLTAQGKQFVTKNIHPIMELENSIFTDMSPEESHALLSLARKYVTVYCKKINDYLENIPEDM